MALTATALPPVARITASSTYRAPSASPHPWQARWPEVSELVRSGSAWALRRSAPTRRLPTAELPTW